MYRIIIRVIIPVNHIRNLQDTHGYAYVQTYYDYHYRFHINVKNLFRETPNNFILYEF